KSFKLTPSVLIYWSFLILQILGLLQSEHLQEGIHSIEVKLSLFLLPILFSTESYYSTTNQQRIFYIFYISCFLSFIYTVIHSYFLFSHLGLHKVFHRMSLSEANMHAGYYSNYFTLAVLGISEDIRKNKRNTEFLFLKIALLLFFLGIIFILASKTALILIVLYVLFGVYKLSQMIQSKITRIAIGVTLSITLVLGLTLIPTVQYRIQETIKNLNTPNQEINFSNSSGSRKVAWHYAGQLISKRWMLGYGTGDGNALLLHELETNHYDDLVKHNMHTHNQILHTWLENGILGVCLLLAIVGISLIIHFKQRQALPFWFAMLVLVNISTDDMFEIQAGIVFFVVFLTLHLFPSRQQKLTS
ncbi:MAG TPA: O-antigen ligase family protein, partial [Chitinophagaceae bacterium]|nr:O-antigen ligase family protein [Chitinophagaceae bacterium]